MFKTIPGFPDYKVNEYGDVISYKGKTSRLLKGGDIYTRNTSRCRIHNLDGNSRIPNYVAVAKAFIPNPKNYHVVRFIDHDPSNIRVSNLYWAKTKVHNKPVCLFESNSLLPIKIWESVSEVANEYGVISSSITSMFKRKSFFGDKSMRIRPFADYIEILKARGENDEMPIR